MRVVLDTNVIISAFLWAGKVNKILDLIENKKIEVYTCPEQIIELKGVLERPKFKPIFIKAKLKPEIIVSGFLNSAQLIKQEVDVDVIQADPADNVILACALSAGAQYLVTGDKHLLSLKKFQKIKVLTPNEFLEKYKL